MHPGILFRHNPLAPVGWVHVRVRMRDCSHRWWGGGSRTCHGGRWCHPPAQTQRLCPPAGHHGNHALCWPTQCLCSWFYPGVDLDSCLLVVLSKKYLTIPLRISLLISSNINNILSGPAYEERIKESWNMQKSYLLKSASLKE